MGKKKSDVCFRVARSGEACYVGIEGLATMSGAPTLEALAERVLADGVRQLVLDLARCDGVDSTFMGLLLSLSNQLRERGQAGGIVLINVDAHALRQLSSVGLDAFVTIKEGRTELPGELTMTVVDAVRASNTQRLKLMVRAHRELVAADERNRAKFGAFLDGIVAELE